MSTTIEWFISNMKKLFQFLAVIACLAMMFSGLTACNSGESTRNGNVVTFTDALGREVSVPKEPERVAALLSGCAVSLAGLLSFVGLLVPHAIRRVRQENRLNGCICFL